MKDKSKRLTVINTSVTKKSDSPGSDSTNRKSSISPIGLNPIGNFLLKSTWNEAWEIKSNEKGHKYIYGKLPLVLQYGLTMYAGNDGVNIPSIYDGLPIDSQTIYWEDIKDENGVVVGKVLKAKIGGGTLGSLTNVGEWADSVASVDRIMVQKQGSDKWVAMDASKLGTSASFENIFETGEGNAYTSFTLSDDKKSLSLVKGQTFITASESEDITGIKNFINGLKINGVELKYDSTNNAVFIQKSDGSPVNFYSTGGISMYGQGNTSVKTIMDAITANLDTNTLAIENGLLTVVGGTGGIESITKQMVIDALGFTPYDASNPNGYITSATLDGFLPLSGGALNGNLYFGTESSDINRTGEVSRFPSHFYRNVYDYNGQVYDHYYNHKYTASQYTYANLRVKDGSGFRTLYFGGDGKFKWGPYNVWHSGNDGTGSGLDADTLDGREGSGYTYHINGQTTDVANQYIKIATLPVSANDTLDSVTISGTIGGWIARDKSDLKITVGRRSSIEFKGYSYRTDGWDIFVNGNGELLIYLKKDYRAWDLSVTCQQAVFDYKVGYTPTDTNFTKMSDSRYIVWFNNNGSVESATKLSDNTSFTIWGQEFFVNGGPKSVSEDLSGVGRIIRKDPSAVDMDHLGNFIFKNLYQTAANYWHVDTADGNTIFVVHSNGNIGIGTISPSYPLDVKGRIRTNILEATERIHTLGITTNLNDVWSDGTNTHFWYGYDHRFKNTGVYSTTLADFFGMTFKTDKGNLSITKDGNVGIGTFEPSVKLHVEGNILATGGITVYGTVDMSGDLSGVGRIIRKASSAVDMDHLGNFIFKNLYPTAANYWHIDTADNIPIFCVHSKGNVGIGNTNPSCALDINGSLAVSGDIRMKGSGNYGNTLYFGDGSCCYINEPSDDLLNLYASQGIVLNGGIYNGVSFVGNESNDILTEYYENASITNVDIGWPNTSIRHAISFKWYNSKWSIGNIRDGGASSRGWGVAENGTILKFRVDDTVYSYCGLNVTGNILATGGVTMYSQRSLKNVVNERGLSLDELSVIKPTRYTWKDGRDSKIHIGGIADDIQKVLPEVVYKTAKGVLTMDYGNAGFAIASSLIKPVVDHEQRIKALERENELLKKELNRLRA